MVYVYMYIDWVNPIHIYIYHYIHIYIYILLFSRFMVDTVVESYVWLDPPGVMVRRLIY